MPAEYVEALVDVAEDGISFDGLEVDSDGERFSFQTPSESASDLTLEDLREKAEASHSVTNWYFWHALAPQRDDYWTFLRWLEGAADDTDPLPEHRHEKLQTGHTREWGQVQITVTLDGDGLESAGRRRYDLRHVADADEPGEALDAFTDPLDAREIAREDDDGQYRPLKTAPTLRTGWCVPDLAPADLCEAIEYLYPATIANWYREREEALDLTHWTETMERQTGIYNVNERWDRGEGHEHVEWVAEACCSDAECLKRREWQYDESTDIAVDGGEGQFPCREPCSMVVSATRKWTRLESEETRTYEFALTPSEKAQLEAVIDAVADGRAGEVRDADFGDPANRWRVRFLRAKRFEEGSLPEKLPDEGSSSGG